MTAKSLEPSVLEKARSQLQKRQKKQKDHYDQHTKNLPPLKPDDVVRYQTLTSWEPAVIIQRHSAPRSYDLITTCANVIRRKRRHLKPTLEARPEVTLPVYDEVTVSSNPSPQSPRPRSLSNASTSQQATEKRTRSGRMVKPLLRYSDNLI